MHEVSVTAVRLAIPVGTYPAVATRTFIVLLAVLALCSCGGGELTTDALRKDAEAVQSTAAEGALLAQGVSEGRSTATFARVHSGSLEEQANAVATRLAAAGSAPGLNERQRRTQRLATMVAADLALLGDEPDDRAAAARIAKRLEAEAAAAERLTR
jgi:hypothetical protein